MVTAAFDAGTDGSGGQPLDRRALVERPASFPDHLHRVSQATADRPVPAGEWGAREVARHLIAGETDVHQARLHDLATTDDPHW